MSNNGWKTCSRGHKYRGPRCTICWKKKRSRAGHFALGLLCGASMSLEAQRTPVDSVVLARQNVLCIEIPCKPIPDVVLRVAEVGANALGRVARRAQSAGFYTLARSDAKDRPWCVVRMSDVPEATITIHHRDSSWTYGDYRSCMGPLSGSGDLKLPSEVEQLIAVESLIDSIHARSGRK